MRRICMLFLLLACAGIARAEGWVRAKMQYEELKERPALANRIKARRMLAVSRDVRAIEIIAKDYANPDEPEEQFRHLLAAMTPYYCDQQEHVEPFIDWRAAEDDPEDAWLWFQTLHVHCEWRGSDDLVDLALDADAELFHRCAALERLGVRRELALFKLPQKVLAVLPEGDKFAFERARLAESLAAASLGLAGREQVPDFEPAVLSVISLLEREDLSEASRLVIARHLSRLFEQEHVTLRATWYRDLLDASDAPPVTDERYAEETPTFMGLRAHGKRIVYVIDLSDSMLEPLTDDERKDLRGPAITGHDEKPEEDERPDDGLPSEADLPWDKIENRFDLAREYLALSLRRLDKDRHFCVVWFGTESDLAKSTGKMRRATSANVSRVISEFRRIKPGSATDIRPHGTLRGFTNLHGGMRRAFGVANRSEVKGQSYIAEAAFEHGADTIFLITDGRPTCDDWGEMDTVPGGIGAGRDPETGRSLGGGGRATGPGQGMVYGPYGSFDKPIVDDVIRMNLFRKCEIHCIGIGEANMSLLWQFARAGLGSARKIGEEDDDE